MKQTSIGILPLIFIFILILSIIVITIGVILTIFSTKKKYQNYVLNMPKDIKQGTTLHKKENIFFIFPILIIWEYIFIFRIMALFIWYVVDVVDMQFYITAIVLIYIYTIITFYLREDIYIKEQVKYKLSQEILLTPPKKENRVFIFPILVTCWLILIYIVPNLFIVGLAVLLILSLLFAIYLREDRYKKQINNMNNTN